MKARSTYTTGPRRLGLRLLRSTVLLLLAAPFITRAQAEGGRLIECYWVDMPPLRGKQISMQLPDGTQIAGTVNSVWDDGLRMNIARTSNPSAHPVGQARIARQEVTEFQVWRKKAEWKSPDESVMTSYGIIAGAVIGGHGAYDASGGSVKKTLAGVILAGIAGGYVGGKVAGTAHPTVEVDMVRIIAGGPDHSTVEGAELIPSRSGEFRGDGPAIPPQRALLAF